MPRADAVVYSAVFTVILGVVVPCYDTVQNLRLGGRNDGIPVHSASTEGRALTVPHGLGGTYASLRRRAPVAGYKTPFCLSLGLRFIRNAHVTRHSRTCSVKSGDSW